MASWDLTALVNAADPKAPLAERQLWLARLMEWLRHAPVAAAARDEAKTPLPAVRLKLLLAQIDAQPALRERVQALLERFWAEVDAGALFAEFGFGPRLSLASEFLRRLGLKLLPGTPETRNLAELFVLLFDPADRAWVERLDDALLERVAALLAPPAVAWRHTMCDAIEVLAAEVHSGGHASALHDRMDRTLLAARPFRQLAVAAAGLRRAHVDSSAPFNLIQPDT